jgi:hypothetical protein
MKAGLDTDLKPFKGCTVVGERLDAAFEFNRPCNIDKSKHCAKHPRWAQSQISRLNARLAAEEAESPVAHQCSLSLRQHMRSGYRMYAPGQPYAREPCGERSML